MNDLPLFPRLLQRIRVPDLRRGLWTVFIAVGLIGLAACGNSESDVAGDESQASETRRTSGIFGGSVQPQSSRGGGSPGSAPLSAPGGGPEAESQGAAPPAGGTGSGPRGQLSDQEMDVTDLGYTVGSPDAPIQVIEFSDFGCGFCRRFHMNTYPTLHEEYVETGQVAWKYIPFVLGIFPNGEEAAIAGECVLRHGRRAFPEFRDRLFEDQGAWRDSDDPTSVFVEVGTEAGVEAAPLRRCIEEEGTAEQVMANNAVGRRIGLRGTPSFLINGFPLHGAQPLEIFRNIFEDLLSQARR